MVFSNFGAPLYEGFENGTTTNSGKKITIENEEFEYEFVELKEVKGKEGDLKVKVTLPKEEDSGEDIVMCYIIKPQNRTLANYKKTFDDVNKEDEIDKEDFLNNLKLDESEFEKIKEFLANNAAEPLEIPIKYDSLTIKYLLEQDSGKDCDEESDEESDKDPFTNYDKESDEDAEESDEDAEDGEDGEDGEEPFVGSRIEGFNGSINKNNIAHNFNMKLLLKSLLFACLFYLMAHDDTKNVLLKVVKIEKGYYLYLATILFFIIYLILNILV